MAIRNSAKVVQLRRALRRVARESVGYLPRKIWPAAIVAGFLQILKNSAPCNTSHRRDSSLHSMSWKQLR